MYADCALLGSRRLNDLGLRVRVHPSPIVMGGGGSTISESTVNAIRIVESFTKFSRHPWQGGETPAPIYGQLSAPPVGAEAASEKLAERFGLEFKPFAHPLETAL